MQIQGAMLPAACPGDKPIPIISALAARRKPRSVSAPQGARSLLPRALLVPVGFETLAALMLVHLQTPLLFEVAHGLTSLVLVKLAPCKPPAPLSSPNFALSVCHNSTMRVALGRLHPESASHGATIKMARGSPR